MKFTSRAIAAGAICMASYSGAVHSHEFWIEPEEYAVDIGADVRADIRVGQNFKGSAYAYLPPNFRRFDQALDGQLAGVDGRPGDRPAATVTPAAEGLLTLIHVTRDYSLTYDSWEDFTGFVTHKDAAWAIDAHRARGLPETDVKEAYSRYAKSLIAVGDGQGEDRAYGLLTEIVALENPYDGALGDGLDVRVLYEGAPRAEAQVEVFAKDSGGDVTVTTTVTDASGEATVPVEPGTSYLIDAVVIREPEGDAARETSAMWESLWASLTFAVPDLPE